MLFWVRHKQPNTRCNGPRSPEAAGGTAGLSELRGSGNDPAGGERWGDGEALHGPMWPGAMATVEGWLGNFWQKDRWFISWHVHELSMWNIHIISTYPPIHELHGYTVYIWRGNLVSAKKSRVSVSVLSQVGKTRSLPCQKSGFPTVTATKWPPNSRKVVKKMKDWSGRGGSVSESTHGDSVYKTDVHSNSHWWSTGSHGVWFLF